MEEQNVLDCMRIKIYLSIIGIIILGILIFFFLTATIKNNPSATEITASSTPIQNTQLNSPFSSPISNALSRITKKLFGIYVSPNNSPVSPEKFTGYHTGVDFETTPEEVNIDVPIYAICSGKLLVSKFGRGYGGMVVQSCILNNQPITVVYGHVRLTSVKAKIGDNIQTGNFLANLGTGYSSETDGERKHLHLGIHKGSAPNTSGYVSNKNLLSNWIDFEQYLK